MIGRSQAIAAGLTSSAIGRLVEAGVLTSVCHCIYRYSWAPETFEQRAMIAQLFAGEACALSHGTAARIHGLDAPKENWIHVTADLKRRSVPPATRLHRCDLMPWEIKRVGPFNVTDVVRTLFDLGGSAAEEDVEIALDSAVRNGRVTVSYIDKRLARTPPKGRRGFGVLATIISERGDVPATGSALETKVARLIRRYKLPPPVRQFVIDRDGVFVARPDFAYPHARIAIEVQSSTHHFGRQPWEHDLARSSDLAACGWLVVYVTDADVRLRPREAAERIRRALANASPALF